MIVLGYLWLAALWMLADRLPQANALLLVCAVALLCIPAVLGQWHRITVGRLVRLHPFRSGRLLARIASWRMVRIVAAVVVWVVVAALALIQTHLLEAWEWGLMALGPPLYLAMHSVAARYADDQFRLLAYARRWSLAVAGATTFVVLAGLWAVTVWFGFEDAPVRPIGETVHDAQQAWKDAPSGLVRWGLDAAAWGDAITRTALPLPDTMAPWQAVVAVLMAPALIGFWSQTLVGLSLPLSEVRRVFVEPLTDADVPGPVGPGSAAGWSVLVVLTTMLLVMVAAHADAWLKPIASPFAVKMVACERIGEQVYQVGTIDAVLAVLSRSKAVADDEGARACKAVTAIQQAAGRVVDSYIDWYYSVPAEWIRLGAMLVGSADELLTKKFEEKIVGDHAIGNAFGELKHRHEAVVRAWNSGQGEVTSLLERNLLVLDGSQCRLVRSVATDDLTRDFDAFKVRVSTASGIGLTAGVFAAKVTSKAASKATMKLAGNVLMKAAAKKLAGKGVAAAAGAASGAAFGSFLPGAGTLIGALIGAAIGLGVGVGIDIGLLAAEEKLYRDDMRKELLDAFHEVTGSYGQAFGCQ